jgi:hypothetical protein
MSAGGWLFLAFLTFCCAASLYCGWVEDHR